MPLVQKYAVDVSKAMVVAAQNGHIHIIEWCAQYNHTKGLISETLFYTLLHEAVANAHPLLITYLLTSNKWSGFAKPSDQFEKQIIKKINMLLNVSQNNTQKHKAMNCLISYVSLEKWQQSRRFINPFVNEYMTNLYAAHQKDVLEKAVPHPLSSLRALGRKI